MRPGILLLLTLAAIPLHAQQRFEKQEEVCPIPADRRPKVDRFLELALPAAASLEQEFTRSQLLGQIALGNACLEHYATAARLADSAYPAGSSGLSTLGRMLVLDGQLAQADALEKFMTHGTHSFLFGIVEGLVEQHRFAEANTWDARIRDRDVRFSAAQVLFAAQYKDGDKAAALAQQQHAFELLPAGEKAKTSLEEANLELALSAHDWTSARSQISSQPADIRPYLLISIAAGEADDDLPAAHDDLLAASASYIEHRDSPHAGYLISSRLAHLRDYPAAAKAAAAVHDDEWNQRAWTTLATFQAEDGKLAEARESIARIGHGELEHKLDMDALARDTARVRIAEALNAQGHAEIALTFLAEQEDKEDIGGGMLAERVATLSAAGKITQAQSLVESALTSEFISDREVMLSLALVRPWYRQSPADAEHWVAAQKPAQVRAAAWLALADEASGGKPPVYRYFVTWD